MNKLNVIAFASTLAIIDIVLHPLFHLWVYISPKSYESAMNIFVAGLQLNVTSFDTTFSYLIIGTLAEAIAFWILGYVVAVIYNKLLKKI
jgi:hypothetical protein